MESGQWNVAAKQDVQRTHRDTSTTKAQLSIALRLVRLPVSWLCTGPLPAMNRCMKVRGGNERPLDEGR